MKPTDLTGLFGMGAAANTQMDVGLRQSKILKKDIGHVQIVVLPGVHDDGFCPIFFF